jgi:hypothetical protein
VQDDGKLHFVEMAQSFDDATALARGLGELWRGKYVVENEETGERVVVNARDETKN